MRPRPPLPALSLALAMAVTLFAARAHANARLFVLWDSPIADCAQKVTRFFRCVLERPDFDALVRAYPNGESLTFESGVIVASLCAADDFQCLVGAAGISPRHDDVVLHYYAAAPRGGRNSVAQVSLGGASVSIRTAWIATDADCDYQTLAGGHEVYEGITEPGSVDCCDGQVPPTCERCAASCATFRAHSSYALACGGEMFRMPYLGSVEREFDPTGCSAVANSGPRSRSLRDSCSTASECADGLACAPWSTSGGPPFASACCRSVGDKCRDDSDCCGATRCDSTGLVCNCVAGGHFCADSKECCDGAACDPSTRLCAVPPRVAASGGCRVTAGDANEALWSLGGVGVIALAARSARGRSRRSTR